MARKQWDPIDVDQTQFMQENDKQISNASIPSVNNATAGWWSSAGIVPTVTPTSLPGGTSTPNTPTAGTTPTVPLTQEQRYQQQNQVWIQAGWIDYYNPDNEENILKGIFAGTPLTLKSPVIDKARERYNKYNVLSSVTAEQLGDSILSGKIWVWSTELTDLKNYNPELFGKATQYLTNKKNMNEINDMWMSLYNALMKLTPTSTKIKYDVSTTAPTSDLMAWYNEKIQEMVTSKFWPNAEKWYWLTQELLNNPQVQSQKQKITTLEWQKNKLNEDIFNLSNDVRKVLGAEAPESLISAYIWEQTKAISKSLRTVDNNLSVEQANLENYLNEVNTTLSYIKDGRDQDIKKKTGSWGSSSWGTGQSLFDDWMAGAVADGELFNAGTLKKYGLSWKTRWEVMQLLSEAGAWSDVGAIMTKIDWLSWGYGDDFATMLEKAVANKQWWKYIKYNKENYDNREPAVASVMKWSDKTKVKTDLSEAGVKSNWRQKLWKSWSANKVLKNI